MFEPNVMFPPTVMFVVDTFFVSTILQAKLDVPTEKVLSAEGIKSPLKRAVGVIVSNAAESPRVVLPKLLNKTVTSMKVEVEFVLVELDRIVVPVNVQLFVHPPEPPPVPGLETTRLLTAPTNPTTPKIPMSVGRIVFTILPINFIGNFIRLI